MTMVRGEVITALERRRRWSREEKEQLETSKNLIALGSIS
jgi:hypothetical protein